MAKNDEKTVSEVEVKKIQSVDEYYEEKVPLMIARGGSRDDDTETIIINGECTQIKKGEQVMVPRYVYEAVMNSEKQKNVAINIAKAEVNREG